MIYRIRIILDTKEDIIRDLEIEDKSSFEDLHFAIIKSFQLMGKEMASFYISNNEWVQGEEITLQGFGNDKNEKIMKEYSLESLRNNMALVTQETMLFNDTIANNIQYGNLKANNFDLEKASNLAGVNQFTDSLPNKLETIVGESGIKVSGGQRQRIAIARAIIKNSPILLLDEATSSLDNLTENQIQESINQLMKNKTSIVVAHRLSTIEDADLIYVIENGKIIDSGNHKYLLNNSNLYKNLQVKEKLENEN